MFIGSRVWYKLIKLNRKI